MDDNLLIELKDLTLKQPSNSSSQPIGIALNDAKKGGDVLVAVGDNSLVRLHVTGPISAGDIMY